MMKKDVEITASGGLVTIKVNSTVEFPSSAHAEWRSDGDVPEFVGVFTTCTIAGITFVNGRARVPLHRLPDLVCYFKDRSMSIWQASKRLA
jgi:hypothetical protein